MASLIVEAIRAKVEFILKDAGLLQHVSFCVSEIQWQHNGQCPENSVIRLSMLCPRQWGWLGRHKTASSRDYDCDSADGEPELLVEWAKKQAGTMNLCRETRQLESELAETL